MKENTTSELVDIILRGILYGREERHIEYKDSMSWSWKNKDARMINVVKCILGMANLPDGGYIVFGVKQQDNDFIPNGMDPEHFMSFNQDKVDDVVKNYAEPFVEVKVTKVSRDVVNNKAISEGINEFPDDGGDFIVIEVGEFKELPVICKNNCK